MKTLTHDAVIKHNWHQISVLTADLIQKEGYTCIGSRAFENCDNLISITLPDTIVHIDAFAFFDCINLLSITIPKSVISIVDHAFSDCINLRSVFILNGVKFIGEFAFAYCVNLTSIIIPSSVITIGNYAFAHCRKLTSIIISNKIKNIHFNAFYKCGIKLSKHYDSQGRLIAYKGFNHKMCCRGFQYKEGETYTTEEAILCKCGFHACVNPLDIFNYYYGIINEDVFIHEVYLENVIDEIGIDSKVVGNKITIGKRLSIEDINKIIMMS